MAQSISQEAIVNTGLPGATAASRYAGATASGAPTTGTFAVGDFIVDQSGAMYVCTVAGTPGTWVALRNATQLQGTAVSATAPTSNQVLQYNGTAWTPATFSGGAPGTLVSVSIANRSLSSPNTNTFITATALTLTAGTWMVFANFYVRNDTTNGSTGLDVWVGPNLASGTGSLIGTSMVLGTQGGSYGYAYPVCISGIITPSTTTSYYLNCQIYSPISGSAGVSILTTNLNTAYSINPAFFAVKIA